MLFFVPDSFHFTFNFFLILGLGPQSFRSLIFPFILLLNLQGTVFPSINFIPF